MIPEEWEVEPIGNHVKLVKGISYRSDDYCSEEKGLILINLKCVGRNGGFRADGIKYIQTAPKLEQFVSEGDILIANTDLTQNREVIGSPIKIPKLKRKACFSLDLSKLIINKTIDSTFLYYYLMSPNARNFMVSSGTGTTVVHLDTSNVPKMLIILPPLTEQRAIAKILSDLDAKIELNQQINKILEEIGQAIFKHWFVDFEFPNEEGKPYKSSGGEMVYNEELGKEIPKGWRVGRLGELVEQIESGSRPKGGASDSGIPSIGAENILGLGLYDYLSTKYVPEDFYEHMKQGKVRDFDVLFYKDGAQLGRTSILGLGFPFKKCCINEHVFIIRVKSPLNQIFLYFWSTLSSTKDDIRNLNTNSAQPGINKEGVKSLRILVPQRETSDEFERRIKPLIVAIFKNCLESQILSHICDALLPKLVSGKIRVPLEGKE